MKRIIITEPWQVRAAMVAICSYLTTPQANEGDPRFEFVTEGRQKSWKLPDGSIRSFSACASLPHAGAWCLGVRDERLINRNLDGGEKSWIVAIDFSRFFDHPMFHKGRSPSPGDICVSVGPDYHMFVWGGVGLDGNAYTYDYGQFDGKIGKHCGKTKIKKMKWPKLDNSTFVGSLDVTLLDREETAWVPNDLMLGLPDDNPYSENLPVDMSKI